MLCAWAWEATQWQACAYASCERVPNLHRRRTWLTHDLWSGVLCVLFTVAMIHNYSAGSRLDSQYMIDLSGRAMSTALQRSCWFLGYHFSLWAVISPQRFLSVGLLRAGHLPLRTRPPEESSHRAPCRLVSATRALSRATVSLHLEWSSESRS